MATNVWHTTAKDAECHVLRARGPNGAQFPALDATDAQNVALNTAAHNLRQRPAPALAQHPWRTQAAWPLVPTMGRVPKQRVRYEAIVL